MSLGAVALHLPPCLELFQWLLDEWEERGRTEVAEAPSDNVVSSVTLTTTACTSKRVNYEFLPGKLADACSLFLAQAFCLHHSLPT